MSRDIVMITSDTAPPCSAPWVRVRLQFVFAALCTPVNGFMSVIAYSAVQWIKRIIHEEFYRLYSPTRTHMMHNWDAFFEGLKKIVYSKISQLSHNILIKETKMLININARTANFPLILGVYCSRNSFKIKPK